jgi:hypothetical protein
MLDKRKILTASIPHVQGVKGRSCPNFERIRTASWLALYGIPHEPEFSDSAETVIHFPQLLISRAAARKSFDSKNFKLLDQPPCHDQDW